MLDAILMLGVSLAAAVWYGVMEGRQTRRMGKGR